MEKEINELDTLMQQGDSSPGYGVWVPEKNYRYYQYQVYQEDILEKSLKECIESKTDFDPIVPFFGGIAIGVLAAGVLFLFLKH